MELQAEAMRLKAAQENNASLAPVTWLGSEQLVAVTAARDEGGVDQDLGAHSGRVDVVVPDWSLATPVQVAAGFHKVGRLRVPGLAGEYVVTDLGGTMRSATGGGHREGSNSCVVKLWALS